MTIDEAIKWNNLIVQNPNFAASMEGAEAIQLGIEALKYIQLSRKGVPKTVPDLLPGETEK